MVTFEVFDGLKKSEVERIFDQGMIRPIQEKTVLFKKGDIGNEMYVVLTGRIGIYDKGEREEPDVAELGPGSVFGEMAVFEKSHERSASASAMEFSQLLVLSEEALDRFIQKKVPHRFLTNIIAILCHRLRLANK
jgi:CRP/FNR family cyclic AMP-dependent transcriptional regulator